jgi:hypothetical protein
MDNIQVNIVVLHQKNLNSPALATAISGAETMGMPATMSPANNAPAETTEAVPAAQAPPMVANISMDSSWLNSRVPVTERASK